jgi:MFS family permease
MLRALVIGSIVLASSQAHADKKRSTAVALSGIGIGVSSALVLTSFLTERNGETNYGLLGTGLGLAVFTPSLGQYYVGQYLTLGEGIRAAAAGAALYAVATQHESVRCDTGVGFCTSITGSGVVILGLAAIAFVGGAAYDMYDAPDAVDRYNQRHGVFVSLARTPDGQSVPMLVVGGRF